MYSMSVFKAFVSSLSVAPKTFNITKSASFHTGSIYFAARKGTRARKEGKKVKVEIKKEAWAPDSKKKKALKVSRKVDESNLGYPEDDIYIQKDYKQRVYQLQDAIAAIRETHHPTMYNQPNAFIGVTIEVNTKTHQKKTKYMDTFTNMVDIEHTFDHGEDRSIIAFCKEPDVTAQLQELGVVLIGDVTTIKGIERGTVTLPDFQYVVCNPKILADLLQIRGLLKRKLPSLKNGTLGADLPSIVKRLQTGIKYSVKKDPDEPEFGYSDFNFGTLNMPTEHLEDNMKRILRDLMSMRPHTKPEDEEFITKLLIWSEPSPERFKIDFSSLIDAPKIKEIDSDSDDEADIKEMAAKA